MSINLTRLQVDLILPDELYALVEKKLEEKIFSYARVFMSLHDILIGDFFNQYIKAGNIVMLSEGILGIQNTLKLKDGVLTMDIDKATYEKCGLEGTVAPSPGRTHVKSRFKIELDLKLPSMQHGKKGFERIKWAAKNVLTDLLAWLFVDLENEDMTSGMF
jgi:ribonuclease P/MRP protein subunit RPP40